MPKRKAAELGVPGPATDNVPSVSEDPEVLDEDEEDAHSGGSGSDGSSAPEVSSSEDDDEDEDGEDDQLTSNFNARAPEEEDFHGLKKLLANYLNGKDFHNSELVDTIIKQQTVGMLVTSGEDEVDDTSAQAAGSSGDGEQGSIWAVFTALNIEQHRGKTFMAEIRDFAKACCRQTQAREALVAAWDAKGTGLLVSECVLGLHPKLAPLSLRALLDDIRRATTDEPTSELRKAFQFKQFVLLPLVLVETSAVRGLNKEQLAAAAIDVKHIFYMRPEHEYIHRHCAWSHLVSCDKPARHDGFLEYRLLMAIGADKLALVQRDLDAEVANAP